VDVGDDDGLVVVVQRSSATGGGWGWHTLRRLGQGCCGTGLLDEDDGRTLVLLKEHSDGKDPGAGGVVPFLHSGGGGDHGIEFLLKLGSLGSLAVVVGGHRRWWHDTQGGNAAHQRCSGRREGGRPLGFERSRKKTYALSTRAEVLDSIPPGHTFSSAACNNSHLPCYLLSTHMARERGRNSHAQEAPCPFHITWVLWFDWQRRCYLALRHGRRAASPLFADRAVPSSSSSSATSAMAAE
jgi:hypothetical protein